MFPLVLAAGAALYFLNKTLNSSKKKIFISFAIEDVKYRNFLTAQANNERSPFEFIDMSVKQAWDNSEWKEKCKKRISDCDGFIILLSNNTWKSSGARWEIKCARELKIPTVGMHIKKNDIRAIPPELRRCKVITWSWKNLEKFIESIN